MTAPHCFVFPGKDSSGTKYSWKLQRNRLFHSPALEICWRNLLELSLILAPHLVPRKITHSVTSRGGWLYYPCQLRLGVTAPPPRPAPPHPIPQTQHIYNRDMS